MKEIPLIEPASRPVDEGRSITLKLALMLATATLILSGFTYRMWDGVRDMVEVKAKEQAERSAAMVAEFERRYVSREVFDANMAGLRREIELQLRPLSSDVSDIKSGMAVLRSQAPANR